MECSDGERAVQMAGTACAEGTAGTEGREGIDVFADVFAVTVGLRVNRGVGELEFEAWTCIEECRLGGTEVGGRSRAWGIGGTVETGGACVK